MRPPRRAGGNQCCRGSNLENGFQPGSCVPIVSKSPGTQVLTLPRHPLPLALAQESVPNIKEVPNRASIHFRPPTGPRSGWDADGVASEAVTDSEQ